jgi:two-component system chemotaxis response regulator CheB
LACQPFLMPNRDIIVVGTSSGGVEALQELARGLDPALPAAVIVVMHTYPRSRSLLPEILGRAGPLPALHAINGAAIEHGHIYLAPPIII